MRVIISICLLAAVAIGGWLGWALYSPVSPAAPQSVMLHPGYSTRRIANELKAAGVIRSADAFLVWRRLHSGDSLKAGEYLFTKPADAIDVNNRLVRGDIYIRTVVIPEGYNIFEIAQAIQDAGLGQKQDFLAVAKSSAGIIQDLAPGAESLEGFLFPNTYEFDRTQTMQEMAAAMVKQFRQVAREIGLASNVREIVTLGSIVEKETAVAGERPIVASVYSNRAARNMLLQADPTVIYGELDAGSYTGALHHLDMKFGSAYNTYVHTGLPPGPIANPGRAALEAANHPAVTDYFYFVADGTGRHKFSHSLEEHNRNVVAFRRAVNVRR